jgi:hypothetical protein
MNTNAPRKKRSIARRHRRETGVAIVLEQLLQLEERID